MPLLYNIEIDYRLNMSGNLDLYIFLLGILNLNINNGILQWTTDLCLFFVSPFSRVRESRTSTLHAFQL